MAWLVSRTLCSHGSAPNRYHCDDVLIDVPPVEAEESAMTLKVTSLTKGESCEQQEPSQWKHSLPSSHP